MMLQTQNSRTYPDDSTQEMTLLGSSYASVRVAAIRYDAIQEIVEAELEELLSDLDLESVIALLDVAPDAVYSEDVFVATDDGNLEEFVFKVRHVFKCLLTIEFLSQKRESMLRTGRLIGDVEASARMSYLGPDQSLWLASCLRKPGERVICDE